MMSTVRTYTVAEVAALMGLSRQTVTRLFQHEPGVIVLERPERLHKRAYRSIRIPHVAYERVVNRLMVKIMRTSVLVFLVVALFTVSAQSDSDETVKHAAQTVAHLHDSMLDPASFVLDAAYVTKPDKHGTVSYCYEFRSHNRMGALSDGRAVEDGSDRGRLSVYDHPAETGGWVGYDTGWVAPCKRKNIDRDITARVVVALAPSLYQKTK